MSNLTKAGLVCWLLALTMPLAAGCHSMTDGRPTAGRAEPSSAKPRPSASVPSPTPKGAIPAPPPSPSPKAPKGAIPLPSNDNGYVFIETTSGRTRCQISSRGVGCEAPFSNSPMKDGEHANGVNINSDGTVEWVLGNLGDIPTVAIDYRTYTAAGWTIVATLEGTKFTNEQTAHGMFVSIEKVDTF